MPTNDTNPNAPVGVDPHRASVARVYDALLGGKENYAVDRQVMKEIMTAVPDIIDAARENRAFLIRLCRFMASQTGVVQYLDCGSGLPTSENTHQVVQRLNPESKVVYVDNDPVVLAHGRALLEEDERTRLIRGDLFEPSVVLEDKVVRTHLDFTQPIALFQLATLHHYKGPRHRAAEVMREYIDALPSGSYVAISHFFDPEDDDTAVTKAVEEAVRKGSLGGATPRTRDEIMELFAGLEMVEPGLVPLTDWWPDGPRLKPRTTTQQLVAGGVGRKP
jgi:SAM-dependent methyltransferase